MSSAAAASPERSPLGSLTEILVPYLEGDPLEELAHTKFIDDGADVPVTPADQLLMSFARRMRSERRWGVVLLPRCRNRVALLLAITSHLLRAGSQLTSSGPVVFVGMDVDVGEQLRRLKVDRRRRMGLADGNPLSLHRLRHAGDLAPVIGSEVRPADRSLVYLNLRVGQPELVSSPPLVIIDATSAESPRSRSKAFEWARARQVAGVVVVGDIGDGSLRDQISASNPGSGSDGPSCGDEPLELHLTDAVAGDLIATLGRAKPSSSALSTASMMSAARTDVTVHPAGDVELNDAIASAFRDLAVRPAGPIPGELDTTLSLLRNGLRLAARVPEYKTACVDNPRPGELPVPRLLDREIRDLGGRWGSWQTARLGGLRQAVRTVWRCLEEANPKLLALWQVLDALAREGGDGVIAIRCHSRAAAAATLVSLSSGERTERQMSLWDQLRDRVRICRMKDRFAAGELQAQVLTAPPPPWLFSLLTGIEADKTIVIGYEAELRALARGGRRWAEDTGRANDRTARALCAETPEAPVSSVPDLGSAVGSDASAFELPELSLAQVLDAAATALEEDRSPHVPSHSTLLPGESGRRCAPVRLDDGRTWWCPDEEGAPPLVVIGIDGKPTNTPLRELQAGDHILVPAGEGAESIHARLLAATRTNADVQALDLILKQFRVAAKAVLDRAATNEEAYDVLEQAGATAPRQLAAWASGKTIAPRDPGDVEAVFRAAGRACPDLGLIYSVADALRSLSRSLGGFIAAAAGGRTAEAVEHLRDLVGPAAEELLDEFVVVVVTDVGAGRSVPSSLAGRLQ
jgi:hypothetical protein